MKTYHSIQEAADDLRLTTRSIYRQINEGKIQKRKGKGGGWIYVLEDPILDSDVIDDNVVMPPSDVNDITDITKGRHKAPKAEVRSLALTHPSKELIQQAQATGIAELKVDELKARKKLKEEIGGDHTDVSKKEDAVKIIELDVREEKARQELQSLQIQKREEVKRLERMAVVERVKESCVPPPLRKELPPHVFLRVISEIMQDLSKLPDIALLTVEELTSVGMIARERVFNDPMYVEEVRRAKLRMVPRILDDLLHEIYQATEASRKAFINKFLIMQMEKGVLSPEFCDEVISRLPPVICTYNEFVQELCGRMFIQCPEQMGKMFVNLKKFVDVAGNYEERAEFDKQWSKLILVLSSAARG